MTVFFVSRHPGAIAWAKSKNLPIDQWLTHLDPSGVEAGDIVIGVLPIAAAAIVCAKGARFVALEMQLPEARRGQELTQAELEQMQCRLTEFHVTRIDSDWWPAA